LIKPDPTATDKEETEAEMLEIRRKIVADSISFEKAAKKYSDDQETKNNGGLFMDEMTRSSRIPTENLDPIIFFTIDTMQVGQVSGILPYRTADNKEALRIIYYKSKMKPHEANLKDDFQKISYAALQSKKAQAIDEWFEKTRSELFITIDPEFDDCDLLSVKDNF
jgi:peptidyl-prolyl cis-trans isomerase SurA